MRILSPVAGRERPENVCQLDLSTVGNFAGRFDFDAVAYWELRNFGFGESAARDETRSKYQQARLREAQTMDRVAREVVEASAQVQARHPQIALAATKGSVISASYQSSVVMVSGLQGHPLE